MLKTVFSLFQPKTEQQKISVPGPRTLPQLLEILRKDDVFVNLELPLRLMQQYGGICRFPIPQNTYLITGPKEIEEILKTKAQNFTKDNFFYRRLGALFGKSLLVTDGSYWKHRRTISQPAFQPSMIKNYASTMIAYSDALIEDLLKKKSQKRNMVSLMNSLTLKVICKLCSGEEISDKTQKTLGQDIYFCNWYVTHTLLIKPYIPTLSNLRFYYARHRINQSFLGLIRRRRQHPSPSPDLLQMLIDANNEEGHAPLSDLEILSEFKTLILTGHETTAIGLSWMWYLLSKYPTERDLLEQELQEVLGDREPTIEDLPKLSRLRAIICETYRLYPPIWSVIRTNTLPENIGGYSVPEKSLFILHLFALHRNPDYWENPKEFNPERFLKDAQKKQHPFAFLPFISGPRICIANHFAMIETMLITARLAQKLRFELISKLPVYPEPCISLRPKEALWMRVESR